MLLLLQAAESAPKRDIAMQAARSNSGASDDASSTQKKTRKSKKMEAFEEAIGGDIEELDNVEL